MIADDDTLPARSGAFPAAPPSARRCLQAPLSWRLTRPPRRNRAAPPLRLPRKRYDMKKSINLWAFPYPQKMSLVQCLQLAKDAGFDGIELNYDLENDLSPKAGTREFQQIRRMADRIGIAISGLCSFLFWPYPLTSNDAAKRARAAWSSPAAWRSRPRSGRREPAGRARRGAHSVARRSRTRAERRLRSPGPRSHRHPREAAEKLKVSLNIENIFFNGYLMTPMEMNAFVDSFSSTACACTSTPATSCCSSIPSTGSPPRQADREHALQGVHQEGHRLLARNVPAAARRHDQLAGGHGGARRRRLSRLLTFEYFHPYPHYPEALIYQTSDSLDRMLGRKGIQKHNGRQPSEAHRSNSASKSLAHGSFRQSCCTPNCVNPKVRSRQLSR